MKPRLTLLTLMILAVSHCLAQDDKPDTLFAVSDTIPDNMGLFANNDIMRVTLSFDVSQYRNKRSDTEYLPATLTYYRGPSDSITRSLRIRSRGEFRRNYCDFPPLLLNFRLGDSATGEFGRIDKLKLVTECKKGRGDLILKEYIAYRLYNLLTENSFRVRLLKIKYVNTAREGKSDSSFGFAIEPVDFLARRINAVEVKTSNLTQKNAKPEMMDRMAIFNYMIGNTDWSVPIQHNILFLSQPESPRPDLGVIIPFDFDFSGLVNANYASPFPGLKIKDVRERLYLGICRDEETIKRALMEFKEKQGEFYSLINNFPYLNEKTKMEMISYIEKFFAGINDKNTLARKILSECMRF